jgi:hypothetical protein
MDHKQILSIILLSSLREVERPRGKTLVTLNSPT